MQSSITPERTQTTSWLCFIHFLKKINTNKTNKNFVEEINRISDEKNFSHILKKIT